MQRVVWKYAHAKILNDIFLFYILRHMELIFSYESFLNYNIDFCRYRPTLRGSYQLYGTFTVVACDIDK